MRFYFVALKLKLKELLCHKLYVLVLFILPLIVTFLMLEARTHADEGCLKAGVWCDETSILGKQIEAYLLKDEAIRFIPYGEVKQLEQAVALGKVECGFIIDKEIDQKRQIDHFDKVITVVKSPATMAAGPMQEIVTSAIYRYTSYDIAYKVLMQKLYMPKKINLKQWLKTQIETYYEQGNLMQIVYIRDEKTLLKSGQKNEGNIRLAKGLMAVFLLVSSMLVGIGLTETRKNNLYQRLHTVRNKALYPEISFIGANALLQLLVSTLTLIIIKTILAKEQMILSEELGLLIVYIGVLSIVVLLGSLWVKNSQVWFAMLPMLIIANVVFCPIVIDLNSMQTPLKYICYLFLPYYYLKGYASVLLGVGIISTFLYLSLRKKMIR